jgi:hypothetical protein
MQMNLFTQKDAPRFLLNEHEIGAAFGNVLLVNRSAVLFVLIFTIIPLIGEKHELRQMSLPPSECFPSPLSWTSCFLMNMGE